MRTTVKILEGETGADGNELGFFGTVVLEMPNQQQRSEIVRKYSKPSSKEEGKEKLKENLDVYDDMIDLALKRIHACKLEYKDERQEILIENPEELVNYQEGNLTLVHIAEMIIGGIVLGKKNRRKSKEA